MRTGNTAVRGGLAGFGYLDEALGILQQKYPAVVPCDIAHRAKIGHPTDVIAQQNAAFTQPRVGGNFLV